MFGEVMEFLNGVAPIYVLVIGFFIAAAATLKWLERSGR